MLTPPSSTSGADEIVPPAMEPEVDMTPEPEPEFVSAARGRVRTGAGGRDDL